MMKMLSLLTCLPDQWLSYWKKMLREAQPALTMITKMTSSSNRNMKKEWKRGRKWAMIPIITNMMSMMALISDYLALAFLF